MKNCAASVFAIFLLASHAAAAPPSSHNPDGFLPLYSGSGKPLETPQKILAVLQREVPVVAKQSAQQQEVRDGAKFKQLKLSEVAATYLKMRKLRRGVEHLKMWGEPVAFGYERWLEKLLKRHGELIVSIKDDPFFRTKLDRETQKVRNTARVNERMLPRRVDPLIEDGKMADAQTRLDILMDPIRGPAVFYPANAFTLALKEFEAREKKILDPLKYQRGQKVRRDLGKIRDRLLPDYDRAWRFVEDTVLKIESAEPTEPGPLLKKFASGWRDAHLAGVRCQALDWMILQSFQSKLGADERGEWQSKAKRLKEKHDEFTKKMNELVVNLIKADTERSTPKQIEKLYPEYLREVALPIALMNDATFRDRIQEALDAMLAKSSQLKQQVEAYRIATGDILRWRKKLAQANSVKEQRSYPPLNDLVVRYASRSPKETERLLEEDSKGGRFTLRDFARVPTRFLSEKLMGQKVTIGDGLGLKIGDTPSYPLKTRMHQDIYAGFTGKSEAIAADVARLESDLLIGPQLPVPLTLEAQLALASARRGDVLEAGGRVAGLLTESVVTRQASLTPSDWGMLRIDNLTEASGTSNDKFGQVQLRFVISPNWLRNEYFFVALPENKGGKAAE